MSPNVGIDVSKHHLDWATAHEEKIHHVRNDGRSIAALVRRLIALEPERVVVESTGGYERRLVERLAEAGLPVIVVNPWRARRFGEGLGILAKTDPIDARVLALFGERAQPPARPITQGRDRLAADLVARRRQLVAMMVAEKSRLDTAPTALRKEMAGLVRLLAQRVARLERRSRGEAIDAARIGELFG
jgi:transposase